MIVFLVTEEHRYTLAELLAEGGETKIRVVSYAELFASAPLPRATYVFADLDRLAARHIRLAAKAYRQMQEHGFRVLNDPARIPSRFGLLRHLALTGYNGFNAYRVDEGAVPARWPVFLRTEGDHDGPLSDLLHDWHALRRATQAAIEAGHPLPNLLIVEYAAEPVLPGLYRKLSLYKIGPSTFAAPCVHDTHWPVKEGKTGCAPAELYADELRIVRDNPFREKIEAAFELARIDYGRADFGLVGGRVQLYEINTNPNLELWFEHPSADRQESLRVVKANLLAALKAIDTPDLQG